MNAGTEARRLAGLLTKFASKARQNREGGRTTDLDSEDREVSRHTALISVSEASADVLASEPRKISQNW